MKEPEYHHPANPDYKYPSTNEHTNGLKAFVGNSLTTLADMHGLPSMDGKPVSWGSVLTRVLYPDIPVDLYHQGVKVFAFVPYEAVTVIMDLADKRFPSWLTSGGPPTPTAYASGPLVKHEDEGLSYLRHLLDGGEPDSRGSQN